MSHLFRTVMAGVALIGLIAVRTHAQPLPADPALVTGQLDNGLKYIIREHSIPPGRAVMWIHVHSGSLNETDRQRGIAHYLEHMGFNGSENFAPGSLVPFFQSLGMTFGRDQNAFTNMEQTTYQLSLPDAKPETLAKGLTFFSDVVGRLLLQPNEIDAERQIILEERRRGLSGRQRTGEYVMERLTPGSIFGERNTIGKEATIKGVNEQDFRDYYGTWYGASNTTLMVVADTKPEIVIGIIKEKFGDLPTKARPARQELNVKPYDKSFAIVTSDPEIRSESVRITRLELPEPPVTTVQQYRDSLVRRIGISAFNQRLSDKTAAGNVPWQRASVSAGNDANAIYTTELSTTAKRGEWKPALSAAALELQRARAFGFTARELEDVKTEMMSSAERAVETEGTWSAQAIISRLNGSVTDGQPTMASQQRLDLLEKLLPTVTSDEVRSRFAKEFDFSTAAFVAVLPASSEIPTESQLLELGAKALQAKPTEEAEHQYASQLMSHPPPPGAVAEGAEHEPSKVWSGWLSNNVRIHYRFMDQQKNEVSINISLIGGELLETATNRGITSAAQLAWSRPATQHLSSTDIRELMTGKKVSVGGGGGFGGGRGGGRRGGGGGGGSGDSISLRISGSPADLETGFQLAYLLLTEPKIESSAFSRYQTTTREFLEEGLKNPMMLGMRTAGAAPYPEDEVRTKPLTAEQLDKLTLDAAQAWLEKLITESPIEMVIIGDLPRERALELATKYVGALPSRARVNPQLYSDLRQLKRPVGARNFDKTVDTQTTQQAFVLCGFYGADESNRSDSRALNMAARVLSTRMTKQVREEAQLVYSIGASSRAASTYPGFGVFSAGAPTDPAKCAALVQKLTSMYDEFARSGPTDEEMTVARKQFANTYEQQLKEPGFWSGRLNQLTFRGLNLDDLVSEPDVYQSMTAAQIKDTFAKYWSKDNSIVVVVKPQNSGEPALSSGRNGDGGGNGTDDRK